MKNWKNICQRIIKRWGILLLLISIFVGFFNGTKKREFWAAEKEMFFTLTKEEEDYLESLRATPLSLGVCDEKMWEEGQPGSGLASPLLDVLHYEFGLEIEVVQETWKKNTAALSAGELDFLFGVPAVLQEEKALYSSEWLYKKPYVLIGYTGEKEDKETEGSIVAYVAKNPVSESILPHLSNFLDGDIKFLSCKNESAVFRALKNNSAAVGLLPEDALFARYPAEDFSVISKLSQYSNAAALGTAQEKFCPLLEILNRYLNSTQEGDILREAINTQQQNIKWETLRKKEEKLIKELQERGESLFYAQADSYVKGILPEFLTFVEESTKLILRRDSRTGESALQALEEGELLFVAGVQLLNSSQRDDFVPYQKQRIVPVIPEEEADSAEAVQGEGEIARRYWGAVSELMPLFAGTAFDGHTVEFSDEEALYQAMNRKEIGGMLISKESFDAMLLAGEHSYTVIEKISFPVKSGLKFLEGDSSIELFSRLWQFYDRFLMDAENMENPYKMALKEADKKQEILLFALKIVGVSALFFAVLFLVTLRTGKKQKKKR